MKKIFTLLAIMMVAMMVNATRTVTKEWNLINLASQKSTDESPVSVNLDDLITLSGSAFNSGSTQNNAENSK